MRVISMGIARFLILLLWRSVVFYKFVCRGFVKYELRFFTLVLFLFLFLHVLSHFLFSILDSLKTIFSDFLYQILKIHFLPYYISFHQRWTHLRPSRIFQTGRQRRNFFIQRMIQWMVKLIFISLKVLTLVCFFLCHRKIILLVVKSNHLERYRGIMCKSIESLGT